MGPRRIGGHKAMALPAWPFRRPWLWVKNFKVESIKFKSWIHIWIHESWEMLSIYIFIYLRVKAKEKDLTSKGTSCYVMRLFNYLQTCFDF